MALLSGQSAGIEDTAEALFKEARRRARRRRALMAAAGAAVLIAGTSVLLASRGGYHPPVPTTTPAPRGARPAVNTAAFSRHGLLAFVSHGGLWVLDGSDGSLRHVVAGDAGAADPMFSPDGKWLAYLISAPSPYGGILRALPGQLWMARSDGAAAHPVAGLTGVSALTWSPSGDQLAAVETPVDTTAASAIWLVRPTGTAQMVAGTAHAANVVWSPDGRFVAFAGYYAYGSLRAVAVSGGTPVLWFDEPYDPRYPASFNPARPAAWLSNGAIVFWIDTDDSSSVEADGLKLYEVHSPGGPAVPLVTTLTSAGSVTADRNGTFAIVSGGDRYAWLTKTVEICADASATCTPVPAPPSDVTVDPAWSPDGRTLAYVEAPSQPAAAPEPSAVARWYAQHSLWIAPVGGGPPVRIAGAGGASVPQWSGNGKSLLYEADDGLWLAATLSTPPVEIASPLFPVGPWPSYYAQIDWTGQFAWWSAPGR